MKRYIFSICVSISIVLLFAWSASAVTVDGQQGMPMHGGHYYLAILGSVTWMDAYNEATGEVVVDGNPFQSHLATITTDDENAFIYGLLTGFYPIYVDPSYVTHIGRGWIGGFQLTDQSSVSQGWQWVTGESMSYTNWDPALGDSSIPSPNDAGGPNSTGDDYYGLEDNGENVMEMRGEGYWDDLNDAVENSGYVVELEPAIDLITDGGDNPTEVGDLHVSYFNGFFHIEYTVDAPWEVVQTHVYIGNEPPAKSSPGRFPYAAGSIPFTMSDNTVIAAHAEIRMQTGEDEFGSPIYAYESVWAQDGISDEPIGNGANWATCFEYQILN